MNVNCEMGGKHDWLGPTDDFPPHCRKCEQVMPAAVLGENPPWERGPSLWQRLRTWWDRPFKEEPK